jgi:hypothetical protein
MLYKPSSQKELFMKKFLIALAAISVIALPSAAEARKGKSARKSASISRTAKPKPAPVAQQKAAPTTPSKVANDNGAAQQAAPAQKQGGGFLSNVAATAVGVAAGSMIADAMTNNASAEDVVEGVEAVAVDAAQDAVADTVSKIAPAAAATEVPLEEVPNAVEVPAQQ